MQPLVSIIIPTYNRANLIGETLESVLAQTYTNWECIIVDDGSTDNTDEVVVEYVKKDSRFQYYHRSKDIKKGASSCRNIGFELSLGEYIQYLDADDLIHSCKLEFQLKKMIENYVDISFSKWVNFSYNKNTHSPFRFENIDFTKPKTGKDLMISFGMNNWFVPQMSWLIKRSIIHKAGLWNADLTNNDDGEFFSRVLYYSEKLICLDEVYAYYRVLPNSSLSKLDSEEKINSAFKSYQLIESFLKNDQQKELLSYPKRLYYIHFSLIRHNFPKLSKRAANAFDCLQVRCFLNGKTKYMFFVNCLGLYYGTKIYKWLLKALAILKG